MTSWDVIVIGAGAAGLAAAHQLSRAGLQVIVLEARPRTGGRIFTSHEAASGPIEFGAEFKHGRSQVLEELLQESGIEVEEPSGDMWCCVAYGRVKRCNDVMEAWRKVSSGFEANGSTDQSFNSYLSQTHHSDGVRALATAYVEGFHAAPPDSVSVQSLALETAASDRNQGATLFRFTRGYDAVMNWLGARLDIRLNCAVQRVDWAPGEVRVGTLQEEFKAKQCIVTLPVSLLAGDSIDFHPEISSKREAARRLAMGNAVHLSLRFRENVWESRLAKLGFLFCPGAIFPTWWARFPQSSPVITAWAGGPKADALLGSTPERITHLALQTLARVLDVTPAELERELEKSYFHDWSADPFSRGAYSYTPVNAFDARRDLAAPIDGTLFFAGEATHTNGEHATVHGALETGLRAARQILSPRS